MLKFGSEWKKHRGFRSWAAFLALGALTAVLLTGCGKFFPSGDTLVAIVISPNNPTIQPSKTQQFTATGTFGDNSTKDISSTVTWSSSTSSVATINSSGLATAGTSTGVSTTITAKSGNQTASTTLTVSNQTSNGLTISCTGCTPQGTGAFTAPLSSSGLITFTATDTSGAVNATWSSDNPAISIGINTGVVTFTSSASGQTARIMASGTNGATGTVTLTVLQ
jgi:trimeric autotransporter adhesin